MISPVRTIARAVAKRLADEYGPELPAEVESALYRPSAGMGLDEEQRQYVDPVALGGLIVSVATLAWLWVVRWRTTRHRAAIWRSLVLPAGGVVLAWNLAMTLWLPPLDYARSYRPHVELLKRHIPSDVPCIAAPGLPRALTAALEYHGRWRVDTRLEAGSGNCPIWVKAGTLANPPLPPPGWITVALERRPTDRDEITGVFRR